MDVREKLVGLMCDVLEDGCIGHCNHPPCWKVTHAVDGLFAHGVTVQEWISVKDRLPEVCVNVLVEDSGKVLLAWRGSEYWHDATNGNMLLFVTHWMPLPEPPKGD